MRTSKTLKIKPLPLFHLVVLYLEGIFFQFQQRDTSSQQVPISMFIWTSQGESIDGPHFIYWDYCYIIMPNGPISELVQIM